jgi:3-hydroxyacyl-CoA dehydrogenase/enoyl-CoA hydratase/3-hydroxybutyryl-CoA epimerase
MTHFTQQTWKHWRLRQEDGGLAWLEIDCVDAAANTLSAEVMAEFAQVLDVLDARSPKALVIASGKAAGFIAGANIEEFTQLDSPSAARALVERGWSLFNRLAAVRYPTLALIRGHCLGGGLELALACRYRIAVDEPGTKLALPEVMLGIVPGWGGMLRLPGMIGPAAALDMMLTGKGVDAKKAKRLGLVDDCVPLRVMESAARIMALSDAPPRKLPLQERVLRYAMNGPLRSKVADKARKQTAAKVSRDNYPAPFAIIDIWEKYEGNALAVPAGDPSSLEAIFASPTTKNLVRVFFLQERLKAFGKDSDFAPKHVHVVGAGVMGGDIAAVCALRGMRVTLQDQSVERIAPAIQRAAKLFERRYKGDARQVRFALDRLIPDPQGQGVPRADLIIEAIFENLEVKRSLFADLERRAKPEAVLATNTSSLRLEDIATVLQDPSRLVGIHFFNPVPMLPLVEVVQGEATDAAVLRRATGFVRAIDKLPLPRCSGPTCLRRCAASRRGARRKPSMPHWYASACRSGRSNWSIPSGSTSRSPQARHWPERARRHRSDCCAWSRKADSDARAARAITAGWMARRRRARPARPGPNWPSVSSRRCSRRPSAVSATGWWRMPIWPMLA